MKILDVRAFLLDNYDEVYNLNDLLYCRGTINYVLEAIIDDYKNGYSSLKLSILFITEDSFMIEDIIFTTKHDNNNKFIKYVWEFEYLYSTNTDSRKMITDYMDSHGITDALNKVADYFTESRKERINKQNDREKEFRRQQYLRLKKEFEGE